MAAVLLPASVLSSVVPVRAAGYGGYAGVGAVSVSRAPSDYYADVGSPLCEFADEFPLEPEYYAAG